MSFFFCFVFFRDKILSEEKVGDLDCTKKKVETSHWYRDQDCTKKGETSLIQLLLL